ncbi:IPT/TIG domain-containing protein [Geofilum sp. OHC36d9]|uniref:IPT/TIG domain-containing protein n=1 Tax=Geofilum sp. OHC36d9 TaxID=3458413 RepID=UPI0040345B6D
MKTNIIFGVFGLLFFLAAIFGCSKSESVSEAGHIYDPSKAIEIYSFSPDSGGMRDKCIVKGRNFGSDPIRIQVLFNGNRKARVISANGEMIYCMVPKQPDGYNEVAVVVDEDTCVFEDKKFKYSVKELVSTIAGKDEEGGYVDGSLGESRFAWTCGIGYLTGNNLMICERFDWRIRMVAMDDNKVITLVNGFSTGSPAVTKDKKTAFCIGYDAPHIVYRFDQSRLWIPKRVTSEIPGFFGRIQSACLGPNEEWLYFRDSEAKFGRMNISDPGLVEILNTDCGSTVNGTDNHLLYHPLYNCFFMSIEFGHGIYKISLDGKTVEEFAGFNGVGNQDGNLDEAVLTSPMGMKVDREGNIYFAQVQNHVVRKISYPEGLVTTIAGSAGQAGGQDGNPYVARFRGPWDIAIDEEDNFYITQFWGVSVRKLAIE